MRDKSDHAQTKHQSWFISRCHGFRSTTLRVYDRLPVAEDDNSGHAVTRPRSCGIASCCQTVVLPTVIVIYIYPWRDRYRRCRWSRTTRCSSTPTWKSSGRAPAERCSWGRTCEMGRWVLLVPHVPLCCDCIFSRWDFAFVMAEVHGMLCYSKTGNKKQDMCTNISEWTGKGDRWQSWFWTIFPHAVASVHPVYVSYSNAATV